MSERARLFYAAACGKCRFLSRLVTILALGAVERVPLDRAEKEQLYDREHPEARGPVLQTDGRTVTGAGVLLAVPDLLVRLWGRRLRRLLTGRTP